MMILRLFIASIFLTGCLSDFGHERYMKSIVGSSFKKYVERAYTNVITGFVPRKGKRPLFNKTFRWIEKINQQQADGTRIYKYANPYNDCKDTFIVDRKGIVIKAFSEGEDCNAWD